MTAYLTIIKDIFTIAAMIIGGFWALWKFVITRESAWNLQLAIDSKFLPYSNDSQLLCLKIRLKNIGKIGLTPGKKGCMVSVKLMPREKAVGEIIQWDDGKYLLKEYDVIKNRGGAVLIPGYYIEPGCEYVENVWLPVPTNETFITEARFWWKTDEDCISTYEVIRSQLNNPQFVGGSEA